MILKNLKNFSKKIKHIVLENEPNTLIKGTENKKGQNILRQNAEKRIKYQRNEILKTIKIIIQRIGLSIATVMKYQI